MIAQVVVIVTQSVLGTRHKDCDVSLVKINAGVIA